MHNKTEEQIQIITTTDDEQPEEPMSKSTSNRNTKQLSKKRNNATQIKHTCTCIEQYNIKIYLADNIIIIGISMKEINIDMQNKRV